MPTSKKITLPPLHPLKALQEIPARSLEVPEQTQEVNRKEKKQERKKPSRVEEVRDGLRKKRKKASFEYSDHIVDFDTLDLVQQSVLRSVVDPRRIDAPLPHYQTEAEVREFYHAHPEGRWIHFKDAFWFVTLGPFIGSEKAIQKDLHRIREERAVAIAYYPGSGYDIVPRDAMGSDRVVHLSLEGHDSYYRMKHAQDSLHGYEKRDMELVGDFRSSPLKDASVDAVIIKGIPIHSAIEAIEDFQRVLKDDGAVLFVDNKSMVGTSLLEKEINKKFKKVGQRGCIGIYRKKIVQ
jgi:hypothetical protein